MRVESLEDLSDWARKAAKKGIPKALKNGALDSAEHVAGALRDKTQAIFDTRSGTLARSWRTSFIGLRGGAVLAEAYSPLVYARTLDEGATIRPKTVKHLAIPLKRNPQGRWPRDMRGQLYAATSKKGNLNLHSRANGEPLFTLKKEVTIAGRYYVSSVMSDEADAVSEILGDQAEVALDRKK